ncbi:MAG: acyl-CoA dehydrogenase [Intrasporangium sp.]|uniref:acyl-CoA dehydrogenase n=1 Tax=Intrasporangium sp. TaxID=1925024 RepID=UPI0026493466|nr:acyl-CoA dehydrogenase [Intrasporangium sp.]MDN5796928.1 acyl-CoA dehydrogenase [Intrasporangium sp.]
MDSHLPLDGDLVDFALLLDQFGTAQVDPDLIHQVVDSTDAEAAELAQPLTKALTQLGALGVHLPEAVDGGGTGVLGLATLAEALGRRLVPGPALPTALAAAVLHAAGAHELVPALADGSVLGAVGLAEGDLRVEGGPTGPTVSGTSGIVLGGAAAELFVVPATADSGRVWLLLERGSAKVDPVRGYDLTRRGARVTTAAGTAARVLEVDPELPTQLTAVALAAESVGIAAWCTATAADYARVREQFGRPIGSFQAVKHRISRMLVTTEQARAIVWDAARALDDARTSAPERALVAAAAAGLGVESGLSAAKDLINTLGGIGFTWEHLAGFYLRRAHLSRILLGSADRWAAEVGRLALAGARRSASIELPAGLEESRAHIRDELEEAAALPGPERAGFLGDHGYTMPTLPVPWGKGADVPTQLVIAEELARAGLEPHDMVIGNWVVPAVVAFGTDEQKERFVRPSLRGDITWCQLFSEPGAGSDLAALTTRAEKVDGGWRINGQKVWTSGARAADYGILLARTDPTVAKHKGLGYFLLDTAAPGVDIRPLREITGDELFNEVFLDDVLIPDDCLVGGPTDGWAAALNTLASERVAMTGGSHFSTGDEALLAAAPEAGADDPLVLARLGDLLTRSLSSSLLGLRTTLRSLSGAAPGAEASLAKLISTATIQDSWEAVVDWRGQAGLAWPATEPATETATEALGGGRQDDPIHMFLNSRALTIAGGTTDVQLNIVGERILRLPRE